ncbi:MAG TPA: Ig-like domain-containing protein [Pyrinomonadaceae bacterium]
MKSSTPRLLSGNARVFASLFVSFVILVTPIVPIVSAQMRFAGYVKSNSSITDIRQKNSVVPGAALNMPAPDTAIITATKTDSFSDPNGDGKAEAGDTITYDVNISNTGATDATSVTLNDTIDANTTLVPGSLKVSPLAFADTYNATKDISLSISAPGVLANDTGTPSPTAVAIAGGSTAQGGTVTLNSDGSFTYTPLAGFQGTDSFTYTVTNGLTPNDTATATINVDAGPTVISTTPTNGATDVASNSNITVNFSEPVNATTGSFSVECPGGSPQAFNLSASPASSFTLDPVADLPAGTTCTVTVIANQITDADTFDPPDQMASNYVFSFGVKLEAVDDMHSATGNVRINTASSGFSVLSNDSPGVTITAFDGTSAHGGNVTMNTVTGTFTYDPPRGFTGTDTFNYTISNGSGSDTGTVVLTVSDMVWFINSTAGACSSACDGRLTHPFTSLAAFEAINGNGTTSGGAVIDPEAGDNIFIYTGSGNYTGPLTLENNQRVIGQGATSSVETLAGITLAPDSDALPSTGGANPTITNPSDGGIILAQNNNIHGLTISNTTGTGLSGNGFGTLTVSENVDVSNTTTAGVPVNLSNGVLNATFRSISAGNNDANPDPANAIVLSNTTGSFTVAGNGGVCTTGTPTCTGGTIQNLSGHGVSLTNATNVALNLMNIKQNHGSGISGTTVNGFKLDGCLITGNGDQTSPDESGVELVNLSGTAVGGSNPTVINNTTISNSFEFELQITNSTGTLTDFQITNSTISSNGATGVHGNLVNFLGTGTAKMGLTVTNSTFTGNAPNTATAVNADTSASTGVAGETELSVAVSGSNFQSNNVGISVSNAQSGDATFNIHNNTLKGTRAQAINVFTNGNAPFTRTMQGKIQNNVIGTLGVPGSGSSVGNGISVSNEGAINTSILIDGNTVQEIALAVAINILHGLSVATGAQTTSVTVTNNTVRNITGNRALVVQEVNSGHVCADIAGNVFSGVSGAGGNGQEIRLVRNAAGTYSVKQKQPTAAVDPLELDDANGLTTTDISLSGTITFNSGGCTQPIATLLESGAYQREYLAQKDIPNNIAGSLLGGDEKESNVASFVLNKSALDQSSMQSAHAKRIRNSGTASAIRKAAVVNPVLPPSGETVTANIGTLQAGKTVRVQFQVTVNSPLPSGVSQVSNQGTVSGSNFANVLTDDPTVGGSADPTVTPILTPPDITIKDASVAEPSSGSSPAAFAVTLSHSFSQPVTVNFTTANDTGGANPATAGSDYTTTSGTLTFNPGETVQTISVPVLSDADNAETAETFLVNLSGATNGTVTDSQAVGTINPNGTPGTVIISELRTSGAGGPDDDFVELLNNTDSDITVQASDASAGWALVKSSAGCSDTPVVIAVIPNGTVIPARGNYLLVGSAYSLGAYATGDQTLTANIENDRNVALFTTADLSNIQTGTRLDGVGFGSNTGNNCDLLREGATLQPASGSTSEYSFVRKVAKGETLDAGDNATDFRVVSTTPGTPVGSNATPTLGAPGPENSTSPRGPVPCNAPGTAKFGRSRLDASQGFGSAPNLVRDTTTDPLNNSTYGTMDLRRRFTNNTGGSVTRLRFRIVDMTTTTAPSGTADLRARNSSATLVTGVNDAATCNGSAPCNVTVQGTTVETPPLQALGGGVNSTLGAGTITLVTPLASGSDINLRFLFGVEQEGNYHIGIVIETLTSGSIGQDIWELKGNTQTGGHSDGGCNTPPVANAGTDQTVECAGGLTAVTLDGSASSDPDGDTPLTYEWREGVTVLGTGVTLNTSLAFGSHTITLKVTDPSGDFSEDTVTVNVVDTSDPLITAPPNVSVSTGPSATTCGAFVSDATLGTATASDGCSASVTVTRTGVPSGNNFPVGQTFITYTADDGHGHTKNATQTVTVTDNTPPTLSVPPDQTVNAPANSCSANVNPGTATGNDNCPGVTITGTRSDSQPLNAPYPVGTTTITWKATDASNNMTTGNQTITVKDATAPTIVLTSGTITLSPPNHSYQTFSIANLVASVSDLCDGGVDISDVVISQVTSDEIENGNGDGNTSNDIVIAPDCKSVQLRRERQGGGDGRVYKITLKVKDSSGNVATAVRQIFVSNGGPIIDSGAHYTVNGCTP